MTLHIAQITDCHLQENPNTPYKGIDADAIGQAMSCLSRDAELQMLRTATRA